MTNSFDESEHSPAEETDTPWNEPEETTLTHGAATRDRTNSSKTVFDEKRPGDTVELVAEPKRRPVLVVLEGSSSGGLFVFKQDTLLIGRDVDADVILKDGRVSRSHARLTWKNMERTLEDPECVIEDLKSRNGVFVNGKRIHTHRLQDGDRIHCGATLLGFYIKDEKELNADQKLLTMATTDGLTGLANRLYFDAEARREIDRARRYKRPLSFLAIDIDHFKNINDTYGHAAGDTVLRQLARLLLVTLREGDVVGRLGGEEFGALLPETDRKGAEITAERIRQRVADRNFQHDDQKIHVTVSIGVEEYRTDYGTRAEFFDAADKALYQAKSEGRNRVCPAAEPREDNFNPSTRPLPKLDP